MSHAIALSPPRLDPKRIVATSGAIAVHVVILMMLMMPPEVKLADTKETVTQVVFDPPKQIDVIKIPVIKDPPPPIHPTVERTPQIAIQDPPVEPVDDTPGPLDPPVQPIETPPDSFGAGDVSSEFQQLSVVAGPAPTYPKMALARGLQGTVMLRIHVDANGLPIEVTLEKSSGSTMLDEAALKFVKSHWRFMPAQSGGQAIDAWGLVPIEFVLQ